MTTEMPILIDWIDDDFGEREGTRIALPGSLEQQANGGISVRAHVPEQTDDWLNKLRDQHLDLPDIMLIDLRLKSSKVGATQTPVAYDNGHKLGACFSSL